MKNRSLLPKLLLPALVMLVFAGLLLAEMIGMAVEERGAEMQFLANAKPQRNKTEISATHVLVAINAQSDMEMAFATTLTQTLDEMRMHYHTVDIATQPLPELSDFNIFLYCSQSLMPMEDDMNALLSWIDGGGHFALMMTPMDDSVFQILYRKLGIVEYTRDYFNYKSLRYTSDLLPMWGSTIYHENHSLSDFALIVRLDDACTVHMVSGGDMEVPLLWQRDVGKGRIAVLNTTLMVNKSGRGFAVSTLYALEDTIVYPIINAGMIFIDDFPAPQPEGFNETLKQQFGYNIQGFFRNHWWPDMKQLSWDLGVRYTGLLIETYNDNVTGPFTANKLNDSLLKYYAAELLHSGGELGLHGYNHMPLCPVGFDFGDTDYNPWPSTLNMAESLRELSRYGKTLFLGAHYQTYVPPSNFLSDIGRKTLLETLPNIKVVAGLYLSEVGVDALVQEFDEADDGSINVPRITSGFEIDDFMKFVTAQELVLHGVYSHFIHPDDVLDDERSHDLGWDTLYELFRSHLIELHETYPQLRFFTAAEGAAAVQRYDRLSVKRDMGETEMTLTLSNFYDEAWLAFRSRVLPTGITGGELFQIADGFYWIRADEPIVTVQWEAMP